MAKSVKKTTTPQDEAVQHQETAAVRPGGREIPFKLHGKSLINFVDAGEVWVINRAGEPTYRGSMNGCMMFARGKTAKQIETWEQSQQDPTPPTK